METQTFAFSRTRVQLRVDDAAAEAFEPVRRFLRHSLTADVDERPSFTVDVRSRSEYDRLDLGEDDGPVTIRRSTASEFNLEAHRYRRDDRLVYVNYRCVLVTPRTVTGEANAFELGIQRGAEVQAIDFLRDLVIRHEEDLGTPILHAAGLLHGGGGWAIAGSKGAGKTTTLLSLLGSEGWRYWSGDKLFLAEADDVTRARAWRDWPHIGFGTIGAVPWLSARVRDDLGFDASREPAQKKLLIDPDHFEGWVGAPFSPEPVALQGLLLPGFSADAPLAIRTLDDPDEKWALLNQVLDRTSDTTFFTWHTHLVPDYAALYQELSRRRDELTRLPFVRISGRIGPELPARLDEALSRA